MTRYPYLAMTAKDKATAAPTIHRGSRARGRRVAHHIERAMPVTPGTS